MSTPNDRAATAPAASLIETIAEFIRDARITQFDEENDPCEIGWSEAHWPADVEELSLVAASTIAKRLAALQVAPSEGLREALSLALRMLEQHEPNDSRVVSDEFVAMAAVEAGLADDACVTVIRDALAQVASPAPAPTSGTDNDVVAMREALEAAHAVLMAAPELNPSNYDHDQVCELNTAAIEALSILTDALAAFPQGGAR